MHNRKNNIPPVMAAYSERGAYNPSMSSWHPVLNGGENGQWKFPPKVSRIVRSDPLTRLQDYSYD
ncbi:hypothetical protein CPT_Seifer_034 [Klebsiella phage Seifer]|uniref:Uncharacterized protein n=1 Tax=Klebsiella phage Seifer TaxID=2315475 RepID=A0A3B8DHW4_9CAUD|nr:hypothetical protein HWB88_gp34 [Klebsiella phage Seifer]AYJ72816.1 hypothetical protein CPT_Seifer_034 [Klebsiella phage Seifer]